MGSQYFIDHLPKEIGRPSHFHAVVIMDLMGGAHWTPLRNVVFAAGAESSPGLYRRLKQAAHREASGVRGEALARSEQSPPDSSHLTPNPSRLTVVPLGMHLVEEIPLVGRVSFSDYDAFRNVSVPFLFLSSGRTPRYHQPTDLPDTLHYERMAATVSWLQGLLQLLDHDQRPYAFEASRMEFSDDVAALQPLVASAAEWKSRIPGTSPVSLLKLRMDDRWLKELDVRAPTASDVKRLEKLSIRLQCLLADFYGCLFL
jgi:Peptidase family M28